jgi:hypothetical protein
LQLIELLLCLHPRHVVEVRLLPHPLFSPLPLRLGKGAPERLLLSSPGQSRLQLRLSLLSTRAQAERLCRIVILDAREALLSACATAERKRLLRL